jgi:site-specific recombinase XerD
MNAIVIQQQTDLSPVNYQADEAPALVYLASLAESSRRKIAQSLDLIADMVTGGYCDHRSMPWGELRFQHTQAIRSKLMDADISAATANRHLSALRGVLKEAWRLGYMSAEDYQKAIDLKAIKGETPEQAAGRALSSGELSSLFLACSVDETPAGVRDAAILALAYSGGLRRSEIASIQVSDFDAADCKLTVTGKGNKSRTLYVDAACDVLREWLEIRGDQPGPLFVRILKSGKILDSGMTSQAVYNVMQKRANEAGVKEFSPHDMRRTFAGDMLDAGADIATVQKIMGHASVSTTAGYDRRGERAKKAAASKLHIPWSSR